MGTAIFIPVIATLQLLVGYVARVLLVKHKFNPGPGPAIPGEIFGRFGQYALSYFSWDTAYSLAWAVTYLVFFASIVLRVCLADTWGAADERALDDMAGAEALLLASYGLLVFWYPLAVMITCPDPPAEQPRTQSNSSVEKQEDKPLVPREKDPAEELAPEASEAGSAPLRSLTTSGGYVGRAAAVLQAALVCTSALLSVVGLAAARSFSRDSFAPLLFGELTWGFYAGFLTFCCATSVGVAVRRLQVSPRPDYTYDVGTYLVVESCVQQLVFTNLNNTTDNALASSYPKAIEMAKKFVNPAAEAGDAKAVDEGVLAMFEAAREVATAITQVLSTERKLVTDNQRQSATRYVTVPFIRHRGLVYVASKLRESTAGDDAKAPFYELHLGTIVPTLVVCVVSVALPSPCFALGAMLGFVFIINHDISPVRVLRALVALSFAAALVRAVVELVA